MQTKVMIGVPVHNDRDSFKAMMESLVNSTTHYDKIVIIESGSTDGAKEECDWWSHLYPEVKVINTEREGPLKAYNRLFEMAKQEEMDLLLTQTDVLFPKLYNRDWLKIMSEIAQHDKISVVIPINGGGVSGSDYIDGFEWVGGWCTYYPHNTIKHVGGYDDKFPNGFGVDIDHSYRCSLIGAIAKLNYWVDHHMQNERAHDRATDTEEMKQESAKYFKEKWKL